MIEVTRHELEVFKERLVDLCRDMNVTLKVDGFEFDLLIYRGFDEHQTNDSLNHLSRGDYHAPGHNRHN